MPGFQDDNSRTPKVVSQNKGLKISNDNSTVKANKPVGSSAAFDQKINSYVSRDTEYKKKMMELAIQYKNLIEDKTLKINKTEINKNIEKTLLDNLNALASEMNNDPDQPESTGSTSICLLAMKAVFIERDERNAVAYKLFELEKRFATLEKELQELKTKKDE